MSKGKLVFLGAFELFVQKTVAAIHPPVKLVNCSSTKGYLSRTSARTVGSLGHTSFSSRHDGYQFDHDGEKQNRYYMQNLKRKFFFP